ncbi:hypothetical protein NGM10_13865 [Halorussus salilacus]|uniref:DUF7511 domain-containing protein n=1 Tax=Halorussus salilacus TaxID=2953750 RepID=UPI00209F8465|nr:hypothetical protein [Halorussus salilacus]USZ67808.1 hypothetical protein NGM10_13865 [Halorussus salilacus]
MTHDPITEPPDSTRGDATDSTARSPDAEPTARSPDELRSVVVAYDDRPDRRTVFPPDRSGVERMSAWLTADDRVFVDLGDAR